jgi:hypothetical protein
MEAHKQRERDEELFEYLNQNLRLHLNYIRPIAGILRVLKVTAPFNYFYNTEYGIFV